MFKNSKFNIQNLSLFYAHFINDNMPQEQRIEKLNEIAIKQMKILLVDVSIKKIEN